MATPIDPDFRARLNALNDKYAANVPGLMAAIAEALARCEAQGRAPPALAALHKTLHAVAGSAGTFGFAALGLECRRLEQLLRRIMDGAAADGWPALAGGVARLLAWAASDPKAGPPPADSGLYL
ncbi:Hpt domain-containing protein [Janthinobacterium fluminis]|uniref:Hpt domain-containing protein n=1 Tax=Janthinobacterium fluminis TaxID=2987524 RepID=A0ABT5JV84_9BURK|nr:Hpt domain-containing protein [Janthinobacterium fluminis]MDC8756650.1 Hpt domain-containing protein [Janthinobacterium fluminis]